MTLFSSVLAVSFYFDKRRSLAMGIAMCGSGFGIFAFAPITDALLSEYSWKGTVLIEAGILLNCIFCGMVYRPLNIPSKAHTAKVVEETPTHVIGGSEQPIMGVKSVSNFVLPKTCAASSDCVKRRRRFSDSDKWTMPRMTSHAQLEGPMVQKDMFHARSLDHIPQYRANISEDIRSMTLLKDKDWLANVGFTNESMKKPTTVVGKVHSRMKVNSASNLELSKTSGEWSRDMERKRRFSESDTSSVSHTWSTQRAGEMTQKDMFYTMSRAYIPQYQGDSGENVHNTTSVEVQREPQSNKNWLAKTEFTKYIRRQISAIMVFRLFLDTVFILVAVSSVLAGLGIAGPLVFLVNRGLRLGFSSSQSSWLMSAMGIANTIGRVVCGLIADSKCVNRLMLFNTVRVIAGIMSLFSVLLWTFPLQMCYSFILGFCYGMFLL